MQSKPITIPPNTFGDGTEDETAPAAPFKVTNRHARRTAAAQARAVKPTHHNTLANKAERLLDRRTQRGYFEGLSEFIIITSVLAVVGLVLGGMQLVHGVSWLWHHVSIR